MRSAPIALLVFLAQPLLLLRRQLPEALLFLQDALTLLRLQALPLLILAPATLAGQSGR